MSYRADDAARDIQTALKDYIEEKDLSCLYAVSNMTEDSSRDKVVLYIISNSLPIRVTLERCYEDREGYELDWFAAKTGRPIEAESLPTHRMEEDGSLTRMLQ